LVETRRIGSALAWIDAGDRIEPGQIVNEDEIQKVRDVGNRPNIVGPQPFSLEELLKYIDPVPEEETERFVAMIYADRCSDSQPE